MKTLEKQAGFGALEWMVILFVVGILFTTGLKLFPLYIDNMAIKDAYEGLYNEQNPVATKPRPGDIAAVISKKLVTNNIHYLSKDNIEIDWSDDKQMLLKLSYEVRVPVVGNVDAVVSFKNDFYYPKK